MWNPLGSRSDAAPHRTFPDGDAADHLPVPLNTSIEIEASPGSLGVDTLWYYRQVATAFQELLPGQLAEELMEIVIVLENE